MLKASPRSSLLGLYSTVDQHALTRRCRRLVVWNNAVPSRRVQTARAHQMRRAKCPRAGLGRPNGKPLCFSEFDEACHRAKGPIKTFSGNADIHAAIAPPQDASIFGRGSFQSIASLGEQGVRQASPLEYVGTAKRCQSLD